MMCFLTWWLTFDREFIASFDLICRYQATRMLLVVCLSAVLAKLFTLQNGNGTATKNAYKLYRIL